MLSKSLKFLHRRLTENFDYVEDTSQGPGNLSNGYFFGEWYSELSFWAWQQTKAGKVSFSQTNPLHTF